MEDLQRELLALLREAVNEMRKLRADVEPDVETDKRRRDRYIRGFAAHAHQGLLASGKWQPEDHRDLATRAWDLAEMMEREAQHRFGGDG